MLLWIKSLHVMAIISWMAGLLYLYRLFVYHAMETEPLVSERLQVMERRLLNGITTPAAVISAATGLAMLWMLPGYLTQPWMQLKLAFVVGLGVMNALAYRYREKLVTSPQAVPHWTFRLLNEIPTLLMIGIVIMIIVRPWAR